MMMRIECDSLEERREAGKVAKRSRSWFLMWDEVMCWLRLSEDNRFTGSGSQMQECHIGY